MIRRVSLLLLIAVTASACRTESRSTDSGWTVLFDGSSLNGWTPKIRGYAFGEDPLRTFRLEDGLLKVRYDHYETFSETFGHLFHETPRSSYYLEMEYRFVGEQIPDGPGWAWRNSGLMLHSQDPVTMDPDQDFPDSVELQLLGTLPGQERTNANLCTPGTHVMFGSELETTHCIQSSSRSYLDDEWVTVGVLVHENRWFDHRLEGRSVLSYHSPQLDDGQAVRNGFIAIQSESHPLDVRLVRVRPLTDREISWARRQQENALGLSETSTP